MNDEVKAQIEHAPPPTPEEDLRRTCLDLRRDMRRLEVSTRMLKEHPELTKTDESFRGQRGEMIAQSMLAVRHLEDARMRIGKVLQYAGDGVSIYDKA